MNSQRDLRESPLYAEAVRILKLRGVGSGEISDASDVHVSPDGRSAVFVASLVESLHGGVMRRIAEVNLDTGDLRLLTAGPGVDRSPRYSPDGRVIAFLSDRGRGGDFQLHLLNRADGAVAAAPRVDGWVEYLHWSHDANRILLAVAGHGADVAGGQGAISSSPIEAPLPSWMPLVQVGEPQHAWRSAWIYDANSNCVRRINSQGTNIWEAVWCGPDAIAAIVSSGPGEGEWYDATLVCIDLRGGAQRLLHKPRDQLGCLSATPSGRKIAVVETICSDRWIVAGELLLIDVANGSVRKVDTRGVDVSCAEWRSEDQLAIAGHRGFSSVIGCYEDSSGVVTERWVGREITTAGYYISVGWLGEEGDCVLVGEGFERAPEIATIRDGRYRPLTSFDRGYAQEMAALANAEEVRWQAPDGLEITGWLLRPKGTGPFALVMEVHGGPVLMWRPRWLARGSAHVLMLLRHGYAVFWPNPRGSGGHGREFARHVQGDKGGADTYDLLAGLDQLVARGIADPARLGVTGRSYGGYMTSWLITQDQRFAAAVPLAPVTNCISAHLTSNIPRFFALFLNDVYHDPKGRYWERSPVMYAHRVRTPTLNVCGALDKCTPPTQALEFHNALLENGVESVLVTYPEEGHGNQQLPAVADYAARLTDWFEKHMPAKTN